MAQTNDRDVSEGHRKRSQLETQDYLSKKINGSNRLQLTELNKSSVNKWRWKSIFLKFQLIYADELMRLEKSSFGRWWF